MPEMRSSGRLSLQARTEVILDGAPIVEALRPNIGWNGLGFFTRDGLPSHGPVRIRVHFQDREGSFQMEEVPGKLVWVRRDGNFTAAGVAFDRLDPKEQPLVVSFLQYAENFE
jgi:hypothetical protein